MSDLVIGRLRDEHAISELDSGNVELDRWLAESARTSNSRNLTRTWVLSRGDRIVVGYYAIAPCTLERDGLSRRHGHGIPMRIPAYLIAKLALDRGLQGQGLGSHLLMSALARIAAGGDDLGGRYAVVDAIDDNASSLYVHHGFESLTSAPGRLLIPVKDIREAIARLRR